MVDVLRADLAQCARYEQAVDPISTRTLLQMLARPGGLCVALYRLSAALHRRHLRLVARVVHLIGVITLGAEIPPEAEIGPGFVVYHPVGVVIHGSAVLGARVRIHTGVVLGLRSGQDRSGVPRIEDDALIGAGAKILGAVTIGAGARVGANSVVTTDVPPGHVALGVPAQITPPRTPRP